MTMTKDKEKIKEKENKEKLRCKWCPENDKEYIKYHDEEWGRLNKEDEYLYEMLILESFQAGLSWKTVLQKRNEFRKEYSNFDIDKVIGYTEIDIQRMKENPGIIRNTLKIKASIKNSKIFKEILNEYGTFYKYLEKFVIEL